MLKMYRGRAAVRVMLGSLWLVGCTPPAHPLVAGGTRVAFSLDTPVEVIAADPRGKAILDRDLPGLMSNPHYLLFSDMSLTQIAPMSGGRLTEVKLAKVQRDLAELSGR